MRSQKSEFRIQKWLLLACCLLLASSSAFAAFSKVGTVAAPFLKISVGAPTGMGDAFTGIADDASATFYNPAGLAHIGTREVFFNHIAWIAGITHEYISGILPVRNVGTFGISITSLNTGGIEQTTIDNPTSPAREDEGTGLVYDASDMAIGLTYARLITDKLAFGFSAKGITERIWEISSSAVGVDLGLLYNTGWRSLRIGAAVANFGSDMTFSGQNLNFVDTTLPANPAASYQTTPSALPIMFRFGLGYNLIETADNKLVLGLDLVHPSDINETVNIGLEYGILGRYFLRAGYVWNTDISYQQAVGWNQGISAGAGLAFSPVKNLNLKLDYGYRNQGYLGGTHRVTLSVGF
jgi:opacity protein-like surface antigen